MSCLANNYDELKSYLKNKLTIYGFDNTSTVKDSVRALDHTSSHFALHTVNVNVKDKGDDKRRYTLKDSSGGFFVDTFLNWRVTDAVNRLFKKGRTEDEIEAFRTNPDNIVKAEFGTKGHELAQMLGEAYYKSRLRGIPYDNTNILTTAKTGDYTFTNAQVANLEQGVKEIVDEIFAMQNRIDPKGEVHIRFEQLIIDPVKDTGGTMDVIAIFSDKTATIYDYKFVTAGLGATTGRGAGKQLVTDSFIYNSKKEAWKLQLGTYKKILIQRYGIKDVRSTKVVPVWIDYIGDPREKKVNKILIGKNQSEYLKFIHATHAKTTVSEIDELLKSRYIELEKLQKGLKSDENKVKIARIQQSIYELVEGNDIEFMINDALAIAKEYYDKKDMPYEDFNNILSYLKAISNFQQLFEENADLIQDKDTVLYDAIMKVLKKQYPNGVTIYDKLRNIRSIQGVLFDRLINKINNEENTSLRDPDGRIILNEDDFFTKTFLSTSESSNQVFQIAQRSFDKSYQSIREDLESFYKLLNDADLEVTKWIRGRGESYSNLYKYLVNDSGNLFNKVNAKFYTLRQVARNKKNGAWFVQHYDIRDKNTLGETYSQWYTRAKNDYEELLKKRYAHLEDVDANRFRFVIQNDLNNWVANNNLQLDFEGAPIHPEAWVRSNWLVLKSATVQKYKSSEYAFIEQHPALLNYYNTLINANRNFREILGYNTISATFLPKIRADYIEKLSSGQFSSVAQDVKDIFAIRQDDTSFGMYDTDTGELEKTVPIFFTNPFLDADGNVDTNQQTKDITRAFLLFAKMVYNNKYMTEVEAKTLALKTILSTAQYEKRNEKGQRVFDFMHNLAVSNGSEGETSTEKVFNNLVDYHLYGVRVQPFQGNATFTNATMKLKNYVGMKMLGLGVIGATAGYVAAKSQAWIEGRKGVIYTHAQWNNATILQAKEFDKYHALAYFFGTHNDNIIQTIAKGTGPIHNIIGDRTVKEGVRKYINQRTLMRPFSYGDERLDNHITAAMAQNYGIDENGNVKRLSHLPEGSKSIWELFSYSKDNVGFGNMEGEGLKKIIIQFRNAVRAGQKGIKGTMNDEDINYAQTNLILNLVSQFKTWMPGVINERFGKLKYNQMLDAPQWGRYRALWNENEFIDGSNTAIYVLGTTAKMLKYIAKDLITFGPIRRMTGSKIQVNDDSARLYYNKFKQLNPQSELSFDDFIEVKRAAIRASLIEVQVFLALSALIMSMRGDWDDDGEPMWKETWVAHKLYQVLNKASSEVAFTFNPLDYARLIQNPFPIASLFIDTSKMLINTVDESRDAVFGENNNSDKTGKFYYSVGILPGGFQLRRLLDLSEEDMKRSR